MARKRAGEFLNQIRRAVMKLEDPFYTRQVMALMPPGTGLDSTSAALGRMVRRGELRVAEDHVRGQAMAYERTDRLAIEDLNRAEQFIPAAFDRVEWVVRRWVAHEAG